jgi:hypothetical protein
LGWSAPGDSVISFKQTIDFIIELYKIDPNTLEVDSKSSDRDSFIAQTSYVTKCLSKKEKVISRERVRTALKIPAEHYLQKGYSAEILDKYDIGLCDNPNKEMYGRVVIPVYNEKGDGMIGCTARSIHPQCPQCKFYHVGECPPNGNKYSKWRHNFESRFYLYNYWWAFPYLKKTSSAVLVESPGNVLKLEMAGIHNAVALFGSNFTEEQQFLLEKAGVMDLTLLLDNDSAGEQATDLIIKKCERYYNLNVIKVPEGRNDVGEMSIEEIECLKIKKS